MTEITERIKRIPQWIGIALIRFYQLAISPLFPGSCRFQPTCSEYGLQAVRKFGLVRGTYLTARRILRCRPKGGYGYDPVPDEFHL